MRHVFINFFTSGLTDTNDVELIRKVNMLNAIAVISISALVPLGIDALRLGNFIVSFSDLAVALILVTGILYLRYGNNFNFIINVSLLAAGSLFLLLIILKWEGGAGYLWYFVFPLITSFLAGSRKGFIMAALLIAITFLVFVFSDELHLQFVKSWGYRIRFFAAFSVVTILAYAFEKTREKTQALLVDKTTRLNKHVTELEILREKLQESNSLLETRIMERTADLVRINNRLDKQVKEKEILLKEVHHRVKNNLQIISSLLYLQSQKIKDKQTVSYLLDSRNRVLSMALVHENLYQSDNFAEVNLKNYIQSLTSELTHAYGNLENTVSLEVRVEPVPLTIDKAIPVGLIVNELVTNAIKYAFNGSKTGSISIEFKKLDPGKIEITIADNGKGLNSDISFEDMQTLGFTLVRSLVEQIDGTISVQNHTGTKFRIVFEP